MVLAISAENDETESNLLYFYNLKIDLKKRTVLFYFVRSFSAYTLRYDVFRVTKLLPVRESGLLFAVNEGYGVHIFNMSAIDRGDILD